MSEVINNREYRQKILKELISELHSGKSVDEVKERFAKLIEGVSPTEISEMEHSLMMDGMPVEEVQRLCDVHAAVFKDSIEEIHRPQKPEDVPGHPVHTFKLENKKIESLIDKIRADIEKFRSQDTHENIQNLRNDFEKLWEIDKHYLRKENLLFPFMEKYQITAPPKVMWGVDDEIRDAIKVVRAILSDYSNVNKEQLADKAEETAVRVKEMIFKEENILFPMVMETLSEDEWFIIEEGSSEIGYSLLENAVKWKPVKISVEKKVESAGEEPSNNGYIKFDAGIMSPNEINAILNTLPLDMTFVDKDGIVKYFTQGKERIFARTKAIIGREVKNCHPPASVHIVEKIVEDLSSGKKDNEDFWIKMGDKFVYIRYFAVRNAKGEYLGTIEVTQDIKPIQDITGEKRLASST
ncbi:protein of unknown function DUF438 [Ruminiclostridium papyrosolvens DSM 2782]|uniref:PAS/PAC sensor protein n=1 Tax=Ruminiclostridium papyrosolvens DSM 2782 TaxID=588581 RepID=F1TB50_9FIRM|nr:DUF438 domain-containing protein [Ruminiclostridium papyrosolvens]EGD48254.1 protein of unknown function DUF438 [Ruminiclostridium papyrosolvens DSM 2782]WES34239.1 DUF438 domain-containing protein [Ruminiclostridium papyrosolvens DSM 2782]